MPLLRSAVVVTLALHASPLSLSPQAPVEQATTKHRVAAIEGEAITTLKNGAAPMWTYCLENGRFPDSKEWEMIIDVRSPGEFAEDHVPGAVNFPVLDDAERALVGRTYARNCPFEARKVGARLVAKNIAENILAEESPVFHLPRDARVLVYCWRGGERSNALCVAMSRIGWHCARLEGGYKAYRGQVQRLLYDPGLSSFSEFVRVEGPTGTGKGLVLEALRNSLNVLDLEDLARHRGSALGGLVFDDDDDDIACVAQPSQKFFETELVREFRQFRTSGNKIAVESESAKIGTLQIPPPLHSAIVNAPTTFVLDVPLEARVKHLRRTYAVFETSERGAADLKARLRRLAKAKGHAAVDRWHALVDARRWDDLVTDLLVSHYDPAYAAATARDRRREDRKSSGEDTRRRRHTLHLPDLEPRTVQDAARQIRSVVVQQ
mmetsp:Transcript_15235/g.46185  ORF Transcript_15235/g.46185 Transcript_15235/m.46185 type:complete len:436 (-) Transcript_15235:61-1368(-)